MILKSIPETHPHGVFYKVYTSFKQFNEEISRIREWLYGKDIDDFYIDCVNFNHNLVSPEIHVEVYFKTKREALIFKLFQ